MRLIGINIKNFMSIKHLNLDLDAELDDQTFTLIGINESGKSSILQAIALFSGENTPVYPHDYYNQDESIEVSFTYKMNISSKKQIRDLLVSKGLNNKHAKNLSIEDFTISISYSPENPAALSKRLSLGDIKKFPSIRDYSIVSGFLVDESDKEKVIPESTENEEEIVEETLKDYIENNLIKDFWDLSQKVTFWKSESKYLITSSIDIDAFATNPAEISIPLRNCFELSGIVDIPKRLNMTKGNPNEKSDLGGLLSDNVTNHIRKIWPEHKVQIKFQIDESTISFLVMDEGVKHQSKRVSQRSDGFRQFVSFLLTISAENSTEKLSNNILLIDEPETHLHPEGQKDLLKELIGITKNKRNNIVIFATHSNHMIDRENITRCRRVIKKNNEHTEIEPLEAKVMSYAAVNYNVFNIVTSDYHSELYGYLHGKYIEQDDTDENREKITKFEEEILGKVKGMKKKDWIRFNGKEDKKISICTYIRHCNSHPEAATKHNQEYSEDELKESIRFLEAELKKMENKSLKNNYE